MRQEEMHEKIVKETVGDQKRVMKKTLEQEKQKRYAREIIQNKSNAYRQKLTDQYLQTHTHAGTSLVDPTLRKPFFPSEVTRVPKERLKSKEIDYAKAAADAARRFGEARTEGLDKVGNGWKGSGSRGGEDDDEDGDE